MQAEAFYQTLNGHSLFCVLHKPLIDPIGAILYLHPFAEELNRSRRVVARQAAQLARSGYLVLQVDLYGCGDSQGDFANATWQGWRDDAKAALGYLQACTDAPLSIWGLRLGSLLAAAVADEMSVPVKLLFWQPVFSGRLFLAQFLRIKVAADRFDGHTSSSTNNLMAQFESGQAVEVAGYSVSPTLAFELAAAELNVNRHVEKIDLIEIGNGPALSPQLQNQLALWTLPHTSHIVADEQFWQVQGVVDAPNLLTTTLRVLEGIA